MSEFLAGTYGTCSLCGLLRPLPSEIEAVWSVADWNAGQDKSQQQRQSRWLPVCEDCAAAAMTFRVTYPADLAQHQRLAFRLVLQFGITLMLLIAVLFAGRSLVNSDPVGLQLVYTTGWFIVGLGAILSFLTAGKVVSFELNRRRAWSGPWLEQRLIRVLELPTGDQAPYWSRIELTESLKVRDRELPSPPPAPALPPSPPQPLPPTPPESITISVLPPQY